MHSLRFYPEILEHAGECCFIDWDASLREEQPFRRSVIHFQAEAEVMLYIVYHLFHVRLGVHMMFARTRNSKKLFSD